MKTTIKATPAVDRIQKIFETTAYTDMEIIAFLTSRSVAHGKECRGCALEGYFLHAAHRLVELSPHVPQSLKDELLGKL